MTLAALDLLASIVATLLAANLGALHRLAVHDGETGGFHALGSNTDLAPQGIHDTFPDAAVLPSLVVVIGGTLGAEIVRQHVPLATRMVLVQDRVQNLPHIRRR